MRHKTVIWLVLIWFYYALDMCSNFQSSKSKITKLPLCDVNVLGASWYWPALTNMTKHPIPCPKISLEIMAGFMVMMSHWLEQKIQKGPRVLTRGPRAELGKVMWHQKTTTCRAELGKAFVTQKVAQKSRNSPCTCTYCLRQSSFSKLNK